MRKSNRLSKINSNSSLTIEDRREQKRSQELYRRIRKTVRDVVIGISGFALGFCLGRSNRSIGVYECSCCRKCFCDK